MLKRVANYKNRYCFYHIQIFVLTEIFLDILRGKYLLGLRNLKFPLFINTIDVLHSKVHLQEQWDIIHKWQQPCATACISIVTLNGFHCYFYLLREVDAHYNPTLLERTESISLSQAHIFTLQCCESRSKCYFFFFNFVLEGLAIGGLSLVVWYSTGESHASADAAGVTCSLGTVKGLIRDLTTGGTLGVGRTGELAQRAAVVSCVTRE